MDLINILNSFATLFETWGLIIIFIGSLIEITPLGWAVPGGAILVVAGYLSNGNSNIPLIPVIVYGALGAWIALLIAYFLGRKTGMWLVKKMNQQKNAETAKRMLKNNGGAILTTSMLANLTRFWISYIAGVEKYNFVKFNLYAGVASISWVSLMVLLGYFAGFEKENIKEIVSTAGILAWLFLGIAVIVIIKSIRHEHKHFSEDSVHKIKNE